MRLLASRRRRPTPRNCDQRGRCGGRGGASRGAGAPRSGDATPGESTQAADPSKLRSTRTVRRPRRREPRSRGPTKWGCDSWRVDAGGRPLEIAINADGAEAAAARAEEQGPHEVGMRLLASRRRRPTPRNCDQRGRCGGRGGASRGAGAPRSGDATPGESTQAADPSKLRSTRTVRRPRRREPRSRGPTKWGCDSRRVDAGGRPLEIAINADGAEAAAARHPPPRRDTPLAGEDRRAA